MSCSPLLAGFSRLKENLPWVFLSPPFFCHKYTKPLPLSLPNPPSYPHCKTVSLFVHGRKCFNFLPALTFSPFSNLVLSPESKFMTTPYVVYSISSWLFRDLESSETAYLTCDLNSSFFSFSCPLHQAFSLQGILCAQGSSTFPMPPFTILHLELSQQSCARVVYTLCTHFLAISFTPGFSSANLSSPLRLLCRLFFQKFIFTASHHTSQWIISGIPKLLCLCTCSHLCLKYLSPSFISLYSYTFLGCQLSAFSIHGAFA